MLNIDCLGPGSTSAGLWEHKEIEHKLRKRINDMPRTRAVGQGSLLKTLALTGYCFLEMQTTTKTTNILGV